MAEQDKAPILPTNPVETGAAIYIHWPFCEKKCPYCDFNSHVREKTDQKIWRAAMLREIETFALHFPNLTATSIFFGGGTPSLMPPETTAAVIDAVKAAWTPSQKIEITLEANPSSVEAGRFAAYAGAGVNRVSVGVQSFKDSSLKFLGRLHSADEARRALKVARNNFSRVSHDLIYALPHQSLEDWRQELQQALDFSPSHLSLYQLTIEEGTAFHHQYKRGRFRLPNEDEAVALFELTQTLTASAGLPAYETSNHAKPGQYSRHNMAYWQGKPYVGIGPGAHGRLPGTKTGSAFAHQQVKRPEDWLAKVNALGCGVEKIEEIQRDERAIETIMMGLRLKEGISLPDFKGSFNRGIDQYLDNKMVAELTAGGYITKNDSAISVTSKGAPLLNFLLSKLIAWPLESRE